MPPFSLQFIEILKTIVGVETSFLYDILMNLNRYQGQNSRCYLKIHETLFLWVNELHSWAGDVKMHLYRFKIIIFVDYYLSKLYVVTNSYNLVLLEEFIQI